MNQYPRIRDLREDADLTQAQVGERLGLSQRTYAYYESGQRMVPPEVLCALGDAPLGVDVEGPRCSIQMARRFFHPREVAFAEALPPAEQTEALCRLWVAKEAFLKAEGTGLHRPLSSFCVRLTKEGASLEIPGTLLRLHEYALGAYRVCLCARESRPALIPVVPPAL